MYAIRSYYAWLNASIDLLVAEQIASLRVTAAAHNQLSGCRITDENGSLAEHAEIHVEGADRSCASVAAEQEEAFAQAASGKGIDCIQEASAARLAWVFYTRDD